MIVALQSLKNFYESVHFDNPAKAEQIGPDVLRVQMDSLSSERSDVGLRSSGYSGTRVESRS